MPYQRADVEPQRLPADAVEILGERLPRPVEARVQRNEVHALDDGEHAREVVPGGGGAGGNAEAAVAHDHRGRPMPRRAGQQRVP